MSAPQWKAQILICEDEVLIAADLEIRLKRLGYTIVGKATNGEKALELVEQHQPDLVMMDIVLQGAMDGIEAAEVIRKKWGIPVVFLTAYAETDRLERAKLTYPFGYLLKPFQDRDLKITTEMALYVSNVDAERKKVEGEITESEERFRLLFNNSADAHVLYKGDEFIDCNIACAKMLGFSDKKQLLKLHPKDISPDKQPDGRNSFEKAEEMINLTFQNGKHGFEWLCKRIDNSHLLLDVLLNVIKIKGEVLIHGVWRDITDRKQSEEMLKESEEKYRFVFENSNDALFIHEVMEDGSPGCFLDVNRVACDRLGYTREEFLNLSPLDIGLVGRDKKVRALGNSLLDKRRGIFEITHVTKDGRLIPVESSVCVFEYKGRSAIFSIARDITDRKKAEEKVKKQQYYLKKSQELGRIGTWELDLIHNKLYWTDENCRIFGVPEGSVVNYEIFLGKVHPDDLEYVDREWKAALEGKPYDIEHRIVVDKKISWVREKAEVKFNDEGVAVNAIGFTQDITETKRLQRNYQALFREMLDGFVLHEIICDDDGNPVDYRFLDINPAFESLTGLNRSIIGKTVLEVLPGTEHYWIKTYGKIAISGEAIKFENYSQEIDKYFTVNAFCPSPGQFACIFHDITGHKRAKDELEQASDIVENIQIGIHIYQLEDPNDHEGRTLRMLSCNKAAADMTGVPVDEVIGRTLDENFPNLREKVIDNQSKSIPELYAEVVRTGKPKSLQDVYYGDDRVIEGVFAVKAFPLKNNCMGVSFENITSSVLAENALRESEERYRQVFETNQAIKLIIDPADGNIVDANQAACDFYGYRRDDLLSLKITDINMLPPGEVKREMEGAKKVERLVFEFRHRLKSGEVRDVEVYSGPVKTSQGTLLYSIVFDTTERKKAEKALRWSEKDLRESQRIARLGSWRLDVSTNQVVWSEELYKMYGFDPNLPPPPYTEHMKLFTPESWERLSSSLATTVETGIPYELELETVRDDGSNGWIWVRGEPILDSADQTIGLWGAAQDITDRKQNEINLLKNRAKIEAALASMTDAVFISDAEGNLVDFNDAFATFHKFKNKDECSRTFTDYPDIIEVFFQDGTLAPLDQWAIPRALRGEICTDVEYFLKRKDTGETWVGSYNFSPIYGQDDKIIGSVVIGRDITERKRIEEQINTSLKEKETLLKELNHRVKNNMQVIISLMRLQSEKLADDQLKKYFLETQNRIYAMSAIHETLHQSDKLSSVDLSEYLTKLSETTFQTYRTDGGNIQLDTEISSVPVNLDKSYPIGLITNELLSNALKYAYPDSKAGEIGIFGELDGNNVKLVVADRGIGISEDFDWRNTDSLGLQIVRSLVEDQLRGTIDLDRTHGTKWTIIFPV